MRLISWNVQWCRGIDGTVDPARIAREARRLADPDVLCLQEINVGFADLAGASGENEVQALEREFPGYQDFFASAVDVPGTGNSRKHFGNLIASRFPVGRVMRHSLPWPKANVPSMPRAALEAVIQAPFGALRVITTHLEYYSSGHRAAQIERLRELHCETNAESVSEDTEGPFAPLARPASALVCGDFNMPPEDPLRTRFLEAFVDGTPKFMDAWQVLHPGEAHPHTFRVHERKDGQSPYCCDYVFVTENLVPRLRSIAVDADNQASDHQPVIIELG
ncbi:MAG: endonuclease/exonuclease/phosphatase family protein [Betaproteobacteria bacterium]|nr:endonuclease/exonuclease/phosphatase family protein [Betaproteobacteria bacterium]